MTKKQILKILRDYEEDEQIFCIWWDKDCFEHLDMTDDEWVVTPSRLAIGDIVRKHWRNLTNG